MATITIDKLSGDDLVSLSAWLKEREEYNRVYGIGESNATKPPADVSYDRKIAAEYEALATTLRNPLEKLLDFIEMYDGKSVASTPEGAKAIAEGRKAVELHEKSLIPF